MIKMIRKASLLDLAISTVFMVASVNVSAIDCNLANSFVEIEICNDNSLLKLDQSLNENYRFMLNANISDGTRREIRFTQKKWLEKRNKCKSRSCVESSYKNRIIDVCEYPVINGVHPICN